MKNDTQPSAAESRNTLKGVKSWADYEARATAILADYNSGAKSTYQSARVIAAAQITMRDFFALPEVKAAQEAQKRSEFDSPAHRKATAEIVRLADQYNCGQYFE